MREIITNPSKWALEKGQYKTESECLIDDANLKKLASFYSIPSTLFNVDKKFGTSTVKTVLDASVDEVKALVDDDNKLLSFLDPKSRFVDDATCEKLVTVVSDYLKVTPTITNKGLEKTIKFNIEEDTINDTVYGDVYQRSLEFVRLPQGGIKYNVALLRLVCTNGALVIDSQFNKLYRSGMLNKATLLTLANDALAFSVKSYFDTCFFDADHNPLPASVSDFLGMKKTLSSYVEESVSDIYYPTDPIQKFYESQGIDALNESSYIKDTLKSGISYLDSFNILTHGIKEAGPLDVESRVAVSRWLKPVGSKSGRSLAYSGFPHFDSKLINSLKGDA